MTENTGHESEKLSFNRKLQLGRDSYGTVYEGLFEDQPVAVKRILRSSMDDDELFVIREIEVREKPMVTPISFDLFAQKWMPISVCIH